MCITTTPSFLSNKNFHQNSLKATLQKIGFHTDLLSDDQVTNIATRIIEIVKVENPNKVCPGTMIEQCSDASLLYPDWPSLLYIESLIPCRKPTVVTPEMQKQRYENRCSDGVFTEAFIPIPDSREENWSQKKIIQYFHAGYPIYCRLVHKEEEMHGFDGIENAIFPARSGAGPEYCYQPGKVLRAIQRCMYSPLPLEIRLTQETEDEIVKTGKERGISKAEAIFNVVLKNQQKHEKRLQPINPIKEMFRALYDQHASCGTQGTPFKGMVGGTKEDNKFIEEFTHINSSFTQSSKVIIIIDFSARFLYNFTNFSQKREFLALGGILKSEIVAEMDKSEFEAFSSCLRN